MNGRDEVRDDDMGLELKFTTKIAEEIFTGDEIKGEGDDASSMEIALVDVATGELVEVGPDASETVEIVLLKGENITSEEENWTAEQFEDNIVRDLEGKKSLLSGTTRIKLKRGIGVMKKLKFIHRASEKKPLPEFCLGARVVDKIKRVWIKEARTDSFTVKNYRGKYYQKNPTPYLSDAVYRLKNIRKGGKIDIRLREKGIETVEEFLIWLLRNHTELKNIVNMVPKKWSDTVKNARSCRDKKLYCYTDPQQKTTIVFTIIGEVILHFHHNRPTNMALQKHEVEAQLAAAYEHWEDLKQFDDQTSLDEHIKSSIIEALDTMDSEDQNMPIISYLNPAGEISVDDYFPTNGEDFILRSPFPSSDFEAILRGLEVDPAYGPHVAETDAAVSESVVELQNIPIRTPRNRWKLFLYVWRLSSVSKRNVTY